MSDLIRVETIDNIARISLQRAERRNALTRGMIAELTEAIVGIAADASARVMILAADGPVFCAGMDLGEMQERAKSNAAQEEWLRDSQDYAKLLTAILRAPQPVVAVVQGPVLAGGVGIVLACDLVIAVDTAFFRLTGTPARHYGCDGNATAEFSSRSWTCQSHVADSFPHSSGRNRCGRFVSSCGDCGAAERGGMSVGGPAFGQLAPSAGRNQEAYSKIFRRRHYLPSRICGHAIRGGSGNRRCERRVAGFSG